jgi:uncharacterized protein YjbJ (UPF0337 family)
MGLFNRKKTKRAGSDTTGKAEEVLGYVTGDRRVEAEGKIRQAKPDDATVAPAEVDTEEQHVREAHGDRPLQ